MHESMPLSALKSKHYPPPLSSQNNCLKLPWALELPLKQFFFKIKDL